MERFGHPAFRTALLVGVPVDPGWDERVARDEVPRRDYLELARLLDADLIDATSGGGGRFPFATAARLAWAAFRRRNQYDLFISDSERCGLALALLLRGRDRPRHIMIAHRPATRFKLLLGRRLGLYRQIDRILCYAAQRERLLAAGIEPWRAVVLPHGVPDQRFWRPLPVAQEELIASAGREYRDYATLIEAARSLPVRVEIAAASPWSRRRPTDSQHVPENVRWSSLSYSQLRALSARSRFVVVPVQPNEFQAGALVISEAMAMGKAVIASATSGQRDFIRDGVTGLLVPPGDPAALRAAIERLLAHPEEAQRLGQAARRAVEERFNLDGYLLEMMRLAREVVGEEEMPHALVHA